MCTRWVKRSSKVPVSRSYVAFPTGLLAADRGFGIMTDYLKVVEGKQKRGRGQRKLAWNRRNWW